MNFLVIIILLIFILILFSPIKKDSKVKKTKINIISDKEIAYNELEKFIKRKKIFPFNLFNEKNCKCEAFEGTEDFLKELNLKEMNFEDISKLVKSYNSYQKGRLKSTKDILLAAFGEKVETKYNQINVDIFK